jgi:branched-chain amino acid aminotransferase
MAQERKMQSTFQPMKTLMSYKVYSGRKEVTDQQTLALLKDEAVGVFESMRAYAGRILHFEEHLIRFRESARTVGYEELPDLKRIKRDINHVLSVSAVKDVSIRLTWFEKQIFVILGRPEISPGLFKEGVSLKTASFPRGSAKAFAYQAKTSAYQQAVMASTEPNPGKAFDWVFLDQGSYVTETRSANIFLIRSREACRGFRGSSGGGRQQSKSVLLTPPEHLILNGVTRRFVIKCAFELGLKVRESNLTRHDFFNADEAFLSNTSWEILPVRELDGRKIGREVPGPVTLPLHRFLKRRIQVLCPDKSSVEH